MANDELRQLEEIVSSDDFDLRSGEIARKLRSKWELAEAAENLGEHIVIKNLVADMVAEIDQLNSFLLDQVVATEEDKIIRFKSQADRNSYQNIIDLFSGATKSRTGNEISTALAKAKTL